MSNPANSKQLRWIDINMWQANYKYQSISKRRVNEEELTMRIRSQKGLEIEIIFESEDDFSNFEYLIK